MLKIGATAGLVLIALAPLSGCGETKCEPCTDCPDFTGDYYCNTESVIDTCEEWELLEGNTRLRVVSQVTGEKQTDLEIELTDLRGMWAVFDGYLCASADEDFPKNYTFSVTHSPTDIGETEQVNYFLDGFFTAESAEGPTTLTATLNIRHFDTETGEGCDLTGNIRPDL
jgi:hypothetical protein